MGIFSDTIGVRFRPFIASPKYNWRQQNWPVKKYFCSIISGSAALVCWRAFNYPKPGLLSKRRPQQKMYNYAKTLKKKNLMSSVFVHKSIWLAPAKYRTKHLLQNLAKKSFTITHGSSETKLSTNPYWKNRY
jgi:hypothetical protein